MALGDTYNNNEKKKYSEQVYSNYRFSNIESPVDKTVLTFGYWNKLLKIAIAPKKETSDGSVAYDYDNAGAVYLTHTKALILHNEIIKFLEDYKNGSAPKNVGVNSGDKGLIYICNGEEFNAAGPCLVIRKIDEKGNSTSTFVYEFKRNTHQAILNYEEKGGKFESRIYELIEIEQLATQLKSYYESMTMAIAYSVNEQLKYDNSRINTKLKIIGEKLGVEFGKPGNDQAKKNYNTSYFSNAQPAKEPSSAYSSSSATMYADGSLDDIE